MPDNTPAALAAQIEQTRAALAALEKQQAEANKELLRTLHTKYGYKSTADLVRALLPFARGISVAGIQSKGAAKPRAGKISDETKAQIVADLKSGQFTAKALAEKYGVSMPTINTYKKKNNLTQPRK